MRAGADASLHMAVVCIKASSSGMNPYQKPWRFGAVLPHRVPRLSTLRFSVRIGLTILRATGHHKAFQILNIRFIATSREYLVMRASGATSLSVP